MKKRISPSVENVILPIMGTSFEITKYLCMSSCFMGLSALVLFSMGNYVLSFLLGVLCLTSINHWRRYEYGGWRQRLDMAWVNLCGVYGLLDMTYGTEFQQVLFFNLLYCIWIFYRLSMLEQKEWPVFHMSIHLYVSFFIPLIYLL